MGERKSGRAEDWRAPARSVGGGSAEESGASPAKRAPAPPLLHSSTPPPQDATAAFDRALAGGSSERYVLQLYVGGNTVLARRAIARTKAICEAHLPGRYDLEVIDILQQPLLAAAAQIIAVPTLLKTQPPPPQTLLGDLSDEERVLRGLNLRPAASDGGQS